MEVLISVLLISLLISIILIIYLLIKFLQCNRQSESPQEKDIENQIQKEKPVPPIDEKNSDNNQIQEIKIIVEIPYKKPIEISKSGSLGEISISKGEEQNFKHNIINEQMLVISLGEVEIKQKTPHSSLDEAGISNKRHDLDKWNRIPSKLDLDDISVGSLQEEEEIYDFDSPQLSVPTTDKFGSKESLESAYSTQRTSINVENRRESNDSGISAITKSTLLSSNMGIVKRKNDRTSRQAQNNQKNLSSFGKFYQIKEIKSSAEDTSKSNLEEQCNKSSSELAVSEKKIDVSYRREARSGSTPSIIGPIIDQQFDSTKIEDERIKMILRRNHVKKNFHLIQGMRQIEINS